MLEASPTNSIGARENEAQSPECAEPRQTMMIEVAVSDTQSEGVS